MIKTIEISRITTDVKKHGNSGHIILPKPWIGKTVVVVPLEQTEQEDKYINKVSKEVSQNLTGQTKRKPRRVKRGIIE